MVRTLKVVLSDENEFLDPFFISPLRGKHYLVHLSGVSLNTIFFFQSNEAGLIENPEVYILIEIIFKDVTPNWW